MKLHIKFLLQSLIEHKTNEVNFLSNLTHKPMLEKFQDLISVCGTVQSDCQSYTLLGSLSHSDWLLQHNRTLSQIKVISSKGGFSAHRAWMKPLKNHVLLTAD